MGTFDAHAAQRWSTQGQRRNRWRSELLTATAAILSALAIPGIARAEQGTTGELLPVVSLRSAPGEVHPLITQEAEDYKCVDKFSDVASAVNSWVIGNCPEGAILEGLVWGLPKEGAATMNAT